MTERDRAIQRLRDAARAQSAAYEAMQAADKELVEAALALDVIEDCMLPTANDVRGILSLGEQGEQK